MPLSRRAIKVGKHVITLTTRAIWVSGRKELICQTTGGVGMIADEALADALGLLAFIVFLNMANFAAKSFENLTPLDEDKHIRFKSTGNRSTGQE
jgi:hypothetical protein